MARGGAQGGGRSVRSPSLFDAVGGLAVVERVHKSFYDKVYAHPWLGQFFVDHDQQAIELRQTQFMAEKMGGKTPYPGRELPLAHRRMYITDELLELRRDLLRQALQEEGVDDVLITRWLKIDRAFWGKIKNSSLDEFYKTDFKYEQPFVAERPA
ncbi:MAG: group 1 truncated hemoglobin [Mariprofundales bacterium]|nr:group 1 truncated hemoglobin [Mariprofundales bacterium]